MKNGRSVASKSFTLKILALLFLLFLPFARSYAQTSVFNDVNQGDGHFVAIDYLKRNNLIDGYEDGSFKPEKSINRAEALKILFKAIPGQDMESIDKLNFADVKTTDWFYQYVEKAWNNELVKGYQDKLFHPEKNINIAESLKIALIREGKDIPDTIDNSPYKDVATDDWFAPYARIAKDRTIILESRPEGKLIPSTDISRGEFAELIYRLIKSSNGTRFARATWYADFLAKQSTASGEPYEPNRFTVAHKTLPFGTKLLVTSLSNGKTVEVTVNDRGPYVTGVDLDLSRSAFEALASAGTGIINVEFKEIANIDSYGF